MGVAGSTADGALGEEVGTAAVRPSKLSPKTVSTPMSKSSTRVQRTTRVTRSGMAARSGAAELSEAGEPIGRVRAWAMGGAKYTIANPCVFSGRNGEKARLRAAVSSAPPAWLRP